MNWCYTPTNIRKYGKMTEIHKHSIGFYILLLFIVGFHGLTTKNALAVESICAQVKIEISQEMTFERQAFDAHMQIDNGLTNIALENIEVDVLFSDEEGLPVKASSDPTDTDAFFFIRVDSMTGTDDVSGNGTLAPASKADIHWLIIPASASVENAPTGALYYVGARLRYTINNEEETTTVTPDYIHVRPLPLLTLDYFLPDEVYGDDPFTGEVEASVPFSLGVKITNNGHGTAPNVKIDSAQPKIVENEEGLAVDFKIIGSEVNGITAPDTLLIEFGDIAPSSSAIGRWLMTSSLSGRFVEFEAEYSHADELGGELTSLLEAVNTHLLVRDVLVDVPGRDGVKDFLGKDDGFYKVYESDAGVTDVANLTAKANVFLDYENVDEAVYQLDVPEISGFFYTRFDDPQQGNKVLIEIVRSDGKELKPENGWLSKTRTNSTWSYYGNIFDHDGPGLYTLKYIHPSLVPTPPVIGEVKDPVAKEGEELVLVVSVNDPSNTKSGFKIRYGTVRDDFTCSQTGNTSGEIRIAAGRLPVGAVFIDCGDGTAIIRWVPTDGQSGNYPFSFTATNEEGSTTVRYHVVITDKDNTPTVDFTADQLTGSVAEKIAFTDQSISADGIKSWLWDFGDGQTSTERNPDHRYFSAGLYTVSLLVTEIDGDMHNLVRSNFITIKSGTPSPVSPIPGLHGVWSLLLLSGDMNAGEMNNQVPQGALHGVWSLLLRPDELGAEAKE